MTKERIRQLYGDYEKALLKLEEILKEKPVKGSIVVDATIKRFEFTYELAWKLMQKILDHEGIEVNSPRSAIKESFREKIITDGQGWIEILEARNRTSHIYNETQALEICRDIENKFYDNFRALRDSASNFLKQ
ncbi:MAG: nucleotidyltransferase substrate binding protein [Candidatus Omnitrophica bacterium]|nr:nucleotidyltransferase substrate binding protein [Candidatus Omnitrophota bacterium]